MDIYNVITIIKGMLDEIQSFPIINEDSNQKEKAEDLFLRIAEKFGASEDDMVDNLAKGNYDNENGKEVILKWSKVNL